MLNVAADTASLERSMDQVAFYGRGVQVVPQMNKA